MYNTWYDTCVGLEGRHFCGKVSVTLIYSQILMCVVTRSVVGSYAGGSEVLAASCTQEVLRGKAWLWAVFSPDK